MMSKCKSSAMIIALTSVLLTACSEDEREKVFDLIKSSVEVIAEQFMSSEQRLEKQRLNIADFDAGIETEDFFTETSLTVEGEIRFWFKEGNLNYEVYLPEWRVTNQYRQSTGNGEKVIDTIGRFLSD